MLEDGQVVLFEKRDDKLVCCVLNDKHDTVSVREIPVPEHLTQAFEDFLEEIEPGLMYVPLDEAPECMFRALRRS